MHNTHTILASGYCAEIRTNRCPCTGKVDEVTATWWRIDQPYDVVAQSRGVPDRVLGELHGILWAHPEPPQVVDEHAMERVYESDRP